MNCIGINQFDGEYIIGAGKGDTTGPVAGVNMMGYAMPSQIASGLHGRLYARNWLSLDQVSHFRSVCRILFFHIANLRTMFVSECGNEPFIYVTIDNGMCSVALKREVNGSKVVSLLREVT